MDNENIIIDFLKSINIIDKSETTLENIYIRRSVLIDNIENYQDLSENIVKLDGIFSTSSITSLQETTNNRQRWPFLNFIRQLLKSNGYSMKPIRKSAGYTASGKKKYDRYFLINKKETSESNNELNKA
mgnify:CR=1 FL=1|jgi:hypothetical protein|tara:strand:+ start:86 stop:472 length:387 start_codon:yes stop_codon:yes gene_type:complete